MSRGASRCLFCPSRGEGIKSALSFLISQWCNRRSTMVERMRRARERAMKNWLSAKARSYQHPQSERGHDKEGSWLRLEEEEEEEKEISLFQLGMKKNWNTSGEKRKEMEMMMKRRRWQTHRRISSFVLSANPIENLVTRPYNDDKDERRVSSLKWS